MGDIKLGNTTISSFKVGSTDVDAVYLGSYLVWSATPPTPSSPKWVATYTGGTTTSAECDSTSAITQNEIATTDLDSLEIGDCVTSIGNQAFGGCSSLSSVTIGSGVTSIGNAAFANCSGLTSITIPSGVTSIGFAAFWNCSSLTSVTINAINPPTLISFGTLVNTFDNTNDCPIYVPAESVSAYQSAWSTYASRIFAIPSGGPENDFAD